jgi:hypothetical protein
MASRHDRLTIASIAVIASVTTVMLHEGIGHGVTSWLRGDVPTMLTSNHLTDDHPDRLVAAGGTIVNFIAGALAYLAHRRAQSSTWRYALWLFATLNFMEATGYFFFSGVAGFGDWEAVITGLPHYGLIRAAMAVAGAAAYGFTMWRMARALRDYAPDTFALWILPYLAGGAVQSLAGMLDPDGLQLFVQSTIPGTFGGTSGLLWGRHYTGKVDEPRERVVARVPAVWLVALIVAAVHIGIDGPGITLLRGAGG